MSEQSSSFDLDSIANLARLELGETEKDSLRIDMEKIVAYVNVLSELDVEGVEPMAHAAALTNVVRNDRADASFPREAFISNAPETIDDELIKVPKVIDVGV
ncbi:MAG: Asp-tRNA(Asn)/Glu-tRNA(Gln) amidotransferase subunit GatC [Kiritimatiellaeota bacterium]|nr:Asp-tRNA(Asn)/Glu-tRNA(Gln) amidotransferase subunit GatC [Kiritimatiellota bacterium]